MHRLLPVGLVLTGLVLTGLVPRLVAAVPGVPAPPRPGEMPSFSVTFANDLLGLAENQDDFRTVQLGTMVQIDSHWLLGGDLSIFTRRGDDRWEEDAVSREGRIDQATLTIGRTFCATDHETGTCPWLQDSWLAAGLGLRVTGDLGGEDLQNDLHEAIDDNRLDLPYEDTRRVDGLGWFSAASTGSWRNERWLGLIDAWGYWATADALLATNGQFDASIGLSGLLRRGAFTLWSGLRYEGRAGYDFDDTIEHATDMEEGTYVVVGISSGPLSLEMTRNLATDFGVGRISLHHVPDYGTPITNEAETVSVEVGTATDGFPLLAQLRWSPHPIKDLFGRRQRTSLSVLYGIGGTAGSEPDAARREMQHIGGGLDVEIPFVADYPWLNMVAGLGVGWREEGLVGEDGGGEAWAEGPVLSYQLALRGDLSFINPLEGRSNLGVMLGLIGWAPFESETLVFRGSRHQALESAVDLAFGISGSIAY
ncbi:MAG: hypothetical protein ACOCXA_09305 [Planctomycetota bacterium]